MDWEEALTARLKAHADLRALIGPRVHWLVAPQAAERPFVIVQIIHDPRPQTMKGPVGYRATALQADAYADSAADAKAVRQAVIAALADDGVFYGIRFGRGRVDDGRQSVEEVDGVGLVRRDSIECTIWHT